MCLADKYINMFKELKETMLKKLKKVTNYKNEQKRNSGIEKYRKERKKITVELTSRPEQADSGAPEEKAEKKYSKR